MNDIIQENLLISKGIIDYNFENWKRKKKNNILFVTGLSGAGKTTISSKLAERYDATLLQIDHLLWDEVDLPILDKLVKFYPKGTLDEFLKHRKNDWKGLTDNEICDYEFDVLMKCVEYMHNDGKNLYILEGIQVYLYLDPVAFQTCPIILVDNSAMKAMYRRFNRQGNGNILKSEDLRKNLFKMLKWYNHDNRGYEIFKSEVKDEISNYMTGI